MLTKEELKYAQKYPFSSIAKRVVSDSGVSPEDLPEEVMRRAEQILVAAARNVDYSAEITASTDLMRNEVLAYPFAKIILSVLDKRELYSRFALSISSSTFSNLLKDDAGVIQELANDLGIDFRISPKEGSFASMKLMDFLKANFQKEFMKLVNQPVNAGEVYLTKNDFCRFLSELVYQNILDSLPVDAKAIPSGLRKHAKQFSPQLASMQRRSFEKMSFGRVRPEFFPPCISELYVNLMEGKNVPHIARFYLAAFLAGAGMPSEQIISLFKKTPNFKERITRYQVERIAGKKGQKYSPPSCSTLRSQKLCLSRCPVKHPLQYYRNQFRQKLKNKPRKAA